MAEDLRGGLFKNLARSVKGAVNATRAARMSPAEEKAFQERVAARRKKKQPSRKSPTRAVRDAVQSRDVNQALDVRKGLDAGVATKRRMKKAGL